MVYLPLMIVVKVNRNMETNCFVMYRQVLCKIFIFIMMVVVIVVVRLIFFLMCFIMTIWMIIVMKV